MLQKSTVQLLRFHFSFFLLPVYLFALSQVASPNWGKSLLIFLILHFLVYPSSNGYNSYMDRDEESIGGLANPLQPTRQLFITSIVMDIVAIVASVFVSPYFMAGIVLYILASRLYSYRGIRLKKLPVVGYLTVIIFQGAVTFWLVYHGTHASQTLHVPVSGMLASSLLIGGFYPLTQVYQHEADRKDGVVTISAALGYRGTFIFTGIVYFFAFMVLGYHFISSLEAPQFMLLQIFMLPVLVLFFRWAVLVWKDTRNADFKHTMQMNWVAATCTNLAFLILIIWRILE